MSKLTTLVNLCRVTYQYIRISFLNKEEDKFSYIYKNRCWDDNSKGDISLSGSGSSIAASRNLSRELSVFISKNNIASILDVPCGDWEWMSKLNLDKVSYVGGDIVQEIINDNNKKYSFKNISFVKLNLMDDDLIPSDLIIVRDLFVHLKNDDIYKCLTNINNHDFKYIGLTHYPSTLENNEPKFGDRWRALNLLIKPFELNKPDFILSDNSENDSIDKDRTLAIWKKESFTKNLL
jgi:hypothetical protein|tara:strand:- start:2329 stop:3036 length:708 start_codon:yes stop_codon:yes gene_type:complete